MSKREPKLTKKERKMAKYAAWNESHQDRQKDLRVFASAPRAGTTTHKTSESGDLYCAFAFVTRIPPKETLRRDMGKPLVLSDLPVTPGAGPPPPPHMPRLMLTRQTTLAAYAWATSVRHACRLLDEFANSFGDDEVSVYLFAVWKYEEGAYELVEEPYQNCAGIHDLDDRWFASTRAVGEPASL
jgi:hypothetical protein